MIRQECYTREWIQKVSKDLQYPDTNLIEKVIRAFSLIELLSSSGCPFIWKGGTALMLLLAGSRHRLSIDVDVICPPGTEIENYLKDFRRFGFWMLKPLSASNVARLFLNHTPSSFTG